MDSPKPIAAAIASSIITTSLAPAQPIQQNLVAHVARY